MRGGGGEREAREPETRGRCRPARVAGDLALGRMRVWRTRPMPWDAGALPITNVRSPEKVYGRGFGWWNKVINARP